jgi:hypothetical protein
LAKPARGYKPVEGISHFSSRGTRLSLNRLAPACSSLVSSTYFGLPYNLTCSFCLTSPYTVNNTKWKKPIYNRLDPSNALNESGHLLPFLSTDFLNDPNPSPEDDASAATVKGSCVSRITLGLLLQPPDTVRTGCATSRFTSTCRIEPRRPKDIEYCHRCRCHLAL